jgi:membrane-bound metal-dependent hydrolase YbcI (DUF457 family)
MASLFTHALVGTALGQAGISDWRKDWRFWCLVIVCSILPDIDSIGFLMGVPYGNLWGHRGITHSLVFPQCSRFASRHASAKCFADLKYSQLFCLL